MRIQVSQEAASWYIRELELQAGAKVRFFPRYSASGGLHPGFTLGLAIEEPQHSGIDAKVDDITFYMEERDLWYLHGFDLEVKYEESQEDISYTYTEEGAGQ